jgi:hypothetical protein
VHYFNPKNAVYFVYNDAGVGKKFIELYMTTYKIAHNIKTPKVCHAGLSGILLGRKITDKPA